METRSKGTSVLKMSIFKALNKLFKLILKIVNLYTLRKSYLGVEIPTTKS